MVASRVLAPPAREPEINQGEVRMSQWYNLRAAGEAASSAGQGEGRIGRAGRATVDPDALARFEGEVTARDGDAMAHARPLQSSAMARNTACGSALPRPAVSVALPCPTLHRSASPIGSFGVASPLARYVSGQPLVAGGP